MLTPKQERFVAEYLRDLNGTQAAIRAGYSASTANRIAAHLLSKVVIQQALEQRQRARLREVDLKADVVLDELCRIAFSDVRDLYDAEGKLRPIHELSEDVAASVASIDVAEDGRITGIQLWNKLGALKMLCQHLGLLKNQFVTHRHVGPDGGPIQVTAVPLELLTDEELAVVESVLARVAGTASTPPRQLGAATDDSPTERA